MFYNINDNNMIHIKIENLVFGLLDHASDYNMKIQSPGDI
jgi:hypothetical protein